MDRVEKRRQRRLARKAAKYAKPSISADSSPGRRTLNIPQSLEQAVQHHGAGRLPEAKGIYQRILQADPNHPDALHLLGAIALQEGENGIAVELFNKALAVKPDFAEAHSNLGIALKDMGRLDEAVESYRKALLLKPDYVDAHCNLGHALRGLGRLDEAVASNLKALAIKPDYPMAWNNLKSFANALGFLEAKENQKGISWKDRFSPAARATADFVMLEYYLDGFKPHLSDESFRKAMKALPPGTDQEITVDGGGDSANPPRLPEKVVALLHFGRSGTGLLHSLIDGHPEISTLPGIYLRGFFNAGVWDNIAADGWRGLPQRFADEFAVLFDAHSPRPTPGWLVEDSSFLGKKEGMTNVGENRDESLSLDREKFCSEALGMIEGFEKVDPNLFFLVVHAAFEKVMETATTKKTIFYHLHNPNDFAKLNFFRHFPDARLVMMVREPVQCCESWVRPGFENNDYANIVQFIITMLFTIDQIAFRKQASVGVRLEDLKARPEATLRGLCAWLGIQETQSLYEMTAQGKKWWGDPTSPDFDAAKAMSPFDGASTRRAIGAVFSEKDQFVLRTLYYPFSVRFGYRKPDPAGFEKNLTEIRPILEGLLDFEKVLAERSRIDPAQFKQSVDYILLRACFQDRLDVLDEFKDYPHMLPPLEITAD